MNKDIGAYRRFFGTSSLSSSSLSSSESVPLSFSESSPTALAVVSDRLREDLPKKAFQTATCLPRNVERRSRHQHIRKKGTYPNSKFNTYPTVPTIRLFQRPASLINPVKGGERTFSYHWDRLLDVCRLWFGILCFFEGTCCFCNGDPFLSMGFYLRIGGKVFWKKKKPSHSWDDADLLIIPGSSCSISDLGMYS